MKRKKLFLVAAIMILITSACGNATPTARSASDVLESVNTMVALTSAAQQNINVSLSTATQTISPVQATATLIAPTSTISPTMTAAQIIAYSACDSAVYISDVTIADGAEFARGAAFTKTWRIQNTGTCAWNKNYAISFSSGNRMSGEITSINQSVDPNEKVDISVELTAPEEEGTYTGYWILTNGNGTAFGNYVYVQIVVSDYAATSTPTATTDATVTETSTSTSIPAPIPTETPTPAPISTPTPTIIDLPTLRPES